jgi:hypothetical protein
LARAAAALMKARIPQLGCMALIACAACSTAPVKPNQPYKAEQANIAPYDTLDLCFEGVKGDRLDYRFEATRPVAFSIGYRQHEAVLIPWSRPPAMMDSGIYPVLLNERYCISWQAGPPGAFVSYTVVLRR